MDRNLELPEGGALTMSLATAGWGEPADTWREGQRGRVPGKDSDPQLLPTAWDLGAWEPSWPLLPSPTLSCEWKSYQELHF